MLKNLVLWLLAGCALIVTLAIGVVALGFALLVAPVVLLAAGWFVRHKLRAQRRERPGGAAVYEGEFRVLDEKPIEEKG